MCKKWKSLAENDLLWRRMCDTHTGQKCRNCGWGLPKLEQEISAPSHKRQKRTFKDIYGERLTVARNWKVRLFSVDALSSSSSATLFFLFPLPFAEGKFPA